MKKIIVSMRIEKEFIKFEEATKFINENYNNRNINVRSVVIHQNENNIPPKLEEK